MTLESDPSICSQKDLLLNFTPDGSKSMQLALWMPRNTVTIVFGAGLGRGIPVGTPSAERHQTVFSKWSPRSIGPTDRLGADSE
jgi:hypothetical protein